MSGILPIHRPLHSELVEEPIEAPSEEPEIPKQSSRLSHCALRPQRRGARLVAGSHTQAVQVQSRGPY